MFSSFAREHLHLGNIPMKFESQWPKGSGGVRF